MTRTFIALEMNKDLQRYLDGVIRQVAQVLPYLRYVDPYGIHLTLAFLGELTDEQVQDAIMATQEAARQASPFSYRLSRLGIFGSPKQPRVIWMGIDEPTHALTSLHSILNQHLEQRGFVIDKRPFSPHLTLARVKSPLTLTEQQELQQLLSGTLPAWQVSASYTAHHLEVIKSELSRAGAHYTVLQRCNFGV